MRLIVRTSLRNMLDKLPAPLIAEFIEKGYLDSWPLEFTKLGKRLIQIVYKKRRYE